MTCFCGASRVTLSANFPHPVSSVCLLFAPATQLQCSFQPARLSLMWLQLSCHGNSFSPMRQGFSAGKHFRLDTPRLASARRLGDAADKAEPGATHWSVGLDIPLPPGWHHRLRCRPRCPVPWCLLAPPVSKNKFAVLETRMFSCFTAVTSKETPCTEMKELHRKAAAIITLHDRGHKRWWRKGPLTQTRLPESSKRGLRKPSALPFDRNPTHTANTPPKKQYLST